MVDETTEKGALFFGIGAGMYPERHAIQLRLSPEVADEVAAALEENGVRVGPVPMASATMQELVYLAALTGGSLHGIAAVLRAVLHRHQHRAVVFGPDGSVRVKGLSEAETERLVDKFLQDAQERQLRNDELWDEVMPPREEFGFSSEDPQTRDIDSADEAPDEP